MLHLNYQPEKLLAFAAFFLLAYGFRKRDRYGHGAAAAGWILLSVYWLTQITVFEEKGENVNAIYAILAQPLFVFLAYQELLNIKFDEDFYSLKFMAGMTAIAGTAYFIIHTFEDIAAVFIRESGQEAVFVLKHIVGMDVWLDPTKFEDDAVRVPVGGNDEGDRGIAIVLACTALQSIVIFIGAVLCSRGDRKRRFKAFMATVPVVWILNMVRNVSVIYLVYNGILDFDFAHDGLSRWISLGVLIVLAFIMFEILPELHEDIIGIGYLMKRRRRGDAARLWDEVLNPPKKNGTENEDKKDDKKDENEDGASKTEQKLENG